MDQQLDELLGVLPAIAIDGAKGVGKTATASRHAGEVLTLDVEPWRGRVESNPELVSRGAAPVFVDEWQQVPDVWNVIRHCVDADSTPGRFLLAGSATPRPGTAIHSGAGRIVSLVMRPMSLPERGVETPLVSLAELLAGARPDYYGHTLIPVEQYVHEIVASGFPGIRDAQPPGRKHLLDGYLDRIVDRDIPEAGGAVRRPAALRRWLAAYGAATATVASYSTILDAATPGEADKPSRSAADSYRDLLTRTWVLDPLPAWRPAFSHLKRLAQGPKHHLVDPALAARLVGASDESLLAGRGEPSFRRDGTFLGALFESLAVQTVRVLAQAAGATVAHLRDQNDRREVDIIVQRDDSSVVAIDVKLSTSVRPADVTSLNWLDEEIGPQLLDKVVLNAGDSAYRRKDGVLVLPLALLGA
jgi:predicted AAA+ superfamily ATPase